MGGTVAIDASRNLTVGTISSGAITKWTGTSTLVQLKQTLYKRCR